MKKKLFAKYGFCATKKKTGLFDLDTEGVRLLAEDQGWLRDYKVFELMEAKRNIVFHLDDHLDRLIYSKNILNLINPSGVGILSFDLKNFLKQAIKEVLEKNNLPSSTVWIHLTGGHTLDGYHTFTPPNLYICVKPFSIPRFREGEGLKVKAIDSARDLSIFLPAKTSNYRLAETCQTPMEILHYDYVVFTHKGKVLELPKANFFAVKYADSKNIIKTPKEEDILAGITRKIVLDLERRKQSYMVKECDIFAEDILSADELFATGTTIGVWPIVKFDKKKFPVGPITLKLRKSYQKYRNNYYKKASEG